MSKPLADTMLKTQKTVLKNGARIVTETIPSVRSVALGINVDSGSGNETGAELGYSHFLEHLFFKGTEKRSAFDIAHEIDRVGGRMNAATGKEATSYYVVVLDSHSALGLDVLTDIFMNSLFDAKEIEVEKGVVLEEIKMYEDTPDELIHDFFMDVCLPGHPMGRPVLGTPATIKGLTREKIVAFKNKLYSPDRLLITAAGHVEHAQVVEAVSLLFNKLKIPQYKIDYPKAVFTPGIHVKTKETEQVHFCLGSPGLSNLDPDRYKFAVLDTILGSSTSSRLFQEVREKRGLAYSIFSYNMAFEDFGLFAVYGGTSVENLKVAVDVTLGEMKAIRSVGITPEELHKGKEYLKGSMVLGLESTSARMGWITRSEMTYNRVMTLDEVFAEINKVTADDIRKLAERLWGPNKLSLAVIGNLKKKDLTVKELKC